MWRWALGFLAALLGALWAYSTYQVSQIEADYPPTGKFVTVGNQRLHYVEAGEGVPVVLLHGNGANLNDWKASLFDKVAEDHHVIAFDRPGHGHSTRLKERGFDPRVQAAVLHDALTAMGVEKPVLVGHSWGGAVVLAYAIAWPDEVKAILVLAAASHEEVAPPRWAYRVAAVPVLGTVFRHTLMVPLGEVMLAPSVKATFEPNPPPDDYIVKAQTRLLLRPDAFLHAAEDNLYLKTALREMSTRYGEITVPLIIISGTEDRRVNPDDHAVRLKQAVPGARLEPIQDVGHMPHHIRRLLVTDAISRLARGE